MFKHLLLAIFALILCPLSTVYACNCTENDETEAALAKATIVFVGQVKYKKIHPLKKNEYEVKFQVTKKIKGFEEVPGNMVLIYTPIDFEYCGYRFGVGLDYLVYAEGNPAHFKTSSCSRTNILEKSQAEIQKLQKAVGTTPAPAK